MYSFIWVVVPLSKHAGHGQVSYANTGSGKFISGSVIQYYRKHSYIKAETLDL